MSVYYNEFDAKAAAWLRQLIKNGDIADGEVDERSMLDVSASDLRGFTQHHFFAGIGTWSYALRNAGWPDDRPICSASLPCQPFSAAGKQLGKADERHLLPHFIELMRECRFDCIIGEQVESAIRHGWLDDLQTTMEAEGYAVGHTVLGAHSAGAFHQRQRLYWVAGPRSKRHQKQPSLRRVSPETNGNDQREDLERGRGLGDTEHDGQTASTLTRGNAETVCNRKTGQSSTSESEGNGSSGIISSEPGSLVNSNSERFDRQSISIREEQSQVLEAGWSRENDDIEWLYCRDGKYRAIKSGLKPLVDGSAAGVGYSGDPSQPIDADYSSEARVMRLKGYGNAIHAGTAQMFIEAFMETIDA